MGARSSFDVDDLRLAIAQAGAETERLSHLTEELLFLDWQLGVKPVPMSAMVILWPA